MLLYAVIMAYLNKILFLWFPDLKGEVDELKKWEGEANLKKKEGLYTDVIPALLV